MEKNITEEFETIANDVEEQKKAPVYNAKQKAYIGDLFKLMQNAKEERDKVQENFNGSTYIERYEECNRLARSFERLIKNKYDVSFNSGTLRKKLFVLVSYFLRFNYEADIEAYNKDSIKIANLGTAIENIIFKTKQLENDDEKRFLRYFELFKQGTIFVQESWVNNFTVSRQTLKGMFIDEGKKPKITLKKHGGKAESKIISGLDVYLGNMKEYFFEKQPFIFYVERVSYKEALTRYKDFEMFTKYVIKGASGTTGISDYRILEDLKEDEVEIIIFESKLTNEYQIVCNGIPLLPIGTSFFWGDEEYNMIQQNLSPFSFDFAYGQSFVFDNKKPVEALDELIRLGLIKSRKAAFPPRHNMSGRILTPSMFMGGKILNGIAPGTVPPVEGENLGITNPELAMISLMSTNVDDNTFSKSFAGGAAKGGTTATEINTSQEQNTISLESTNLAITLLEKKLSMHRMMNVLEHWFSPNPKIGAARKELKTQYDLISRSKMIPGKGLGSEIVIPTEQKVSKADLQATAKKIEKISGSPARIIALNPKELNTAKQLWYMNMIAKPKKTSDYAKTMFAVMATQASELGLTLDMEYMGEEFAKIWDLNPERAFGKQQQVPEQAMQGGGQQPQRVKTPAINLNKAPEDL